MAELFNYYLVIIGETIASSSAIKVSNDFRRYLKHSTLETIVLDAPQYAEIYNLINTVNPCKASGKDDISPFFNRLGAEVLAPFLSVYFGFCFELAFFPSTFKTAKVVPIFKSGNKHLVQNYRPISLLPCLSKVLEKLIKSRLLKFLTKHKILYDLQYGFREKHSVFHVLLDVTFFSYDAIQNKQTTALLIRWPSGIEHLLLDR